MFFRRRRRARLRGMGLPGEWVEILRRNVPYYRCLTEEERRELGGHVRVFLAEKRFEGCAGLVVTDETRVTIAAQACILLLGRAEPKYYPGLRSILVYPAGYVAPAKEQLPGGVVVEGAQHRLGESWHRGSVVLSWADAREGAADAGDGRNVVFHEFAHQLDSESGAVEGAPALDSRAMYAEWSRVLGAEFEALRGELRARRPTLLGSYAATSPAEFFAVVTEVFFERPVQLRDRHPALYGQMAAYFRQDPAERVAACAVEDEASRAPSKSTKVAEEQRGAQELM